MLPIPACSMQPSCPSWKAFELRIKSWDDLHKLWYVLLKEKNMLMTQRQILHAQNLRFPNPERIPKIERRLAKSNVVDGSKAFNFSSFGWSVWLRCMYRMDAGSLLRVYDITNKRLWWLTDQDYIDE
ncbi:hypothetical protein V6N13_035305 [Hibiscus sabdariffa]